MSDILRVQEFLFNGLLSCDLFSQFNVVLEREFLAQNDLEFNSIWQAPRKHHGPVGIGLYVEMPKLEIPKPNSLQRNLVVSVGVIEERNMNMTAGAGTGVSAEELAELALDLMFGWMLGLSSALTPEVGAVRPAPDLIKGEGLVVYRASVSLRREHRPRTRCDVPTIVEGPVGTFALVNGANTPDAAIYYTLDGQFPGVSSATAKLYSGPLQLAVGTKILYAAWRAGFLPSHITGRQVV